MDDQRLCKAVGKNVMERLNEAGGPVATMGHSLPNGDYEFLLGPVYLPSSEVTLAPGRETRRIIVTLRVADPEE